MKGRWIILLILSVMCIGMAHAVDVNEGVVFHPTGTYAYYNASENLTDVGNITITSSSLSFTTGAGTSSFTHAPTATTYYGIRDVIINFNDTETSTWIKNVTFSIVNEDGDVVGTYTSITNNTKVILEEGTYTIQYEHTDYDDDIGEFTIEHYPKKKSEPCIMD